MSRLVVVMCLATLPAAFAADENPVRRALESHYQHARTLKAAFFERYSDGQGSVVAESGTVYFSRPGRMRWEYQSPEQKLFLVDGKSAWLYVPADQVASHAGVKASSDWRTPLALIAGKADLSSLCRKIEVVEPEASTARRQEGSENTVLRCTPRGDAGSGGLVRVLLEVDSGANLVRVAIEGPGKSETEFRFGNWEENIAVPEAKFHFQAPPGVSIVDEDSLTGNR